MARRKELRVTRFGPGCEPRFVEVHSATSTKNVAEVIQKKEGTQSILRRLNLPIADDMKWYWLTPGRGNVSFGGRSIDKYRKQLDAKRIIGPRGAMTR